MTISGIDSYVRDFNAALARFATTYYTSPSPLAEACRYALAGEGKRVRPLLVRLSAEAFGAAAAKALPAAVAIEMVHTYSLVHDDLPSLDNDDERRGRPTVHVAFDEATALLAGDALLTDAFAVLSGAADAELGLDQAALGARERLAMTAELSRAAGGQGMVEGQTWDLYWTKRQGAGQAELDLIHLNKTGRLIAAATAMGALAAGQDEKDVARLRRFGELVGLAFQVIDDLLDESEGTGKSKGKDLAQGKLTYLATMSRADAEAKARAFTEEARRALAPYGAKTAELAAFAETLLGRRR